jgi:hypothetical protein
MYLKIAAIPPTKTIVITTVGVRWDIEKPTQ